MKRLKKFLAFAVIGVMVFSLAACGGGGEEENTGEVNVYMWSDYMSQDVVDKFTEETGIKVNFSYMSKMCIRDRKRKKLFGTEQERAGLLL